MRLNPKPRDVVAWAVSLAITLVLLALFAFVPAGHSAGWW